MLVSEELPEALPEDELPDVLKDELDKLFSGSSEGNALDELISEIVAGSELLFPEKFSPDNSPPP